MVQKASEFVMNGSITQMNLFSGLYKTGINPVCPLTVLIPLRITAQRIAVGFQRGSTQSINPPPIITGFLSLAARLPGSWVSASTM